MGEHRFYYRVLRLDVLVNDTDSFELSDGETIASERLIHDRHGTQIELLIRVDQGEVT